MPKYLPIVLVVVAHAALFRSIDSLAPFMNDRIVGGTDVNIMEYPYQLSLLSFNKPICGASLIASNWAVTAAHCVHNKEARDLTIIAGTSSISIIGRLKGVSRSVSKLIVHEQFHYLSGYYDIAVLKLSRKLPNNLKIKPIETATTLPENGTLATVTGYGATSVDGSMSKVLRRVSVPIFSFEKCQAAYGIGAISESMCCAGSADKDACAGDSGGPLVFNNTLIGVVSWGYGCGNAKYPGVYANVPILSNWITTTIDKN